MSRACITVIVEDTAGRRGLLGEHGLALWIETGDGRILLDTGQGLALAHNAGALGIQLELADAVALSHGHYDHTGGLGFLARTEKKIKVHAHPEALAAKYARDDGGSVRDVGIPSSVAELVRKHAGLVWTRGPTELEGGLWLTGPVPRVTDFEEASAKFFKDAGCRERDDIPDDQAAFLDRREGSVVLLGCAHAGIVNTLLHVREITGGRAIQAVVGGMHLLSASLERIRRTVDELRRLGVQRIGPAHCTGMEAAARLWTGIPGRCVECPAGTRLEFP